MSYQIKNVALTALNQAKLGEFHMATATQAAETGFNESIATLYARYKALCTTYSTLLKGSYGSDFTTKMQALDAARDSLFGSIRSLRASGTQGVFVTFRGSLCNPQGRKTGPTCKKQAENSIFSAKNLALSKKRLIFADVKYPF